MVVDYQTAKVYIRNLDCTGTVTQTLSNNSINILIDSREIRRNRRAVIPLPDNLNIDILLSILLNIHHLCSVPLGQGPF